MSTIKQHLDDLIKSAITNFASPTLAQISEVNNDNYTCKCIGLTKTGEKTNLIYPDVLIPKFWASSKGGIFMAPSPDTIVVLNFLDNDTNYPIITAIIGSNYSEESKEDTLIITCGDTKLILDDKISLSANGVNLGELLKEIADKIIDLKTTNLASISCPAYVIAPMTASLTLDISQQGEWKTLKSEKINKLFK
ncbi:MAG: hypothetical protein KFW21_05970 [Spirochaetota bacterium]|nr:hypothetical protein [Spirochaetota bacterium]